MVFLVRVFRFLLALLPIVAIGYDIAHSKPDLLNYFSLFTTLSNLIAACLFLYLAFGQDDGRNKIIDSIRGACVGYLLTSSAVYYLLLRDTIGPPPVIWVNTILHKFMPIAVFFDWIIFPPKKHLRFTESFKWLVFPLVYVFYSLIR